MKLGDFRGDVAVIEEHPKLHTLVRPEGAIISTQPPPLFLWLFFMGDK